MNIYPFLILNAALEGRKITDVCGANEDVFEHPSEDVNSLADALYNAPSALDSENAHVKMILKLLRTPGYNMVSFGNVAIPIEYIVQEELKHKNSDLAKVYMQRLTAKVRYIPIEEVETYEDGIFNFYPTDDEKIDAEAMRALTLRTAGPYSLTKYIERNLSQYAILQKNFELPSMKVIWELLTTIAKKKIQLKDLTQSCMFVSDYLSCYERYGCVMGWSSPARTSIDLLVPRNANDAVCIQVTMAGLRDLCKTSLQDIKDIHYDCGNLIGKS